MSLEIFLVCRQPGDTALGMTVRRKVTQRDLRKCIFPGASFSYSCFHNDRPSRQKYTYRRTFGPWHTEVAESPQKSSQGPLIDKSLLICNLTLTKFYYRFKFRLSLYVYFSYRYENSCKQGTILRRTLKFTPSNWVVLLLDWQLSYPPLPSSCLDGEASP